MHKKRRSNSLRGSFCSSSACHKAPFPAVSAIHKSSLFKKSWVFSGTKNRQKDIPRSSFLPRERFLVTLLRACERDLSRGKPLPPKARPSGLGKSIDPLRPTVSCDSPRFRARDRLRVHVSIENLITSHVGEID